MTQRRPTGKKPVDDDDLAATIAPDLDELEGQPMTIRDPTLEVERVALRPKPKRKKKGAGPLAWILVIVILGGIGAAVGIILAQGSGSAGADTTTNEAAATDAGSAADAVAAGDDAVASDDAVAAAEPNEEVAPEVAVAQVEEVAVLPLEEVVAVVDDSVAPEEVAVAATDEVSEDVAVAALADAAPPADDAAAPAADVAVAAVDDAAPAPADAAPAPDDALALADAVAPADVAVVVVVKPPNPAEAKRLNDLGFQARKAGDHAGAMARYKDAIAADGDNIWAHYNYACELALDGKEKDALAELTIIYKLGGPDAKKALTAARGDSDLRGLKDLGQFQRLTR